MKKSSTGGTIFYRYIVEDLKGVLLLSMIFNGNFAISRRITQLNKWLETLNSKLTKFTAYGLTSPIVLVTTLFSPSLTDA